VVIREENKMAVSAASFVHKNCTFSTRFNLLNASNFIYRHTQRCNYFSAHSTFNIYVPQKCTNRRIGRKGVTENPPYKVNEFAFRCTSTDSTTLVGRFQKLRKILYDFVLGGKRLFQDVKLTWKIRRKLRASDWNYDQLERKELWKMFKVRDWIITQITVG
jgi:hypothetical protein